MLSGQIDMTSLPLDYASGFHPEFGATLMPGFGEKTTPTPSTSTRLLS